ncbi:hypothetical protein [uncultured Luteimonas sp.]|uniref:hypothetical protein n=1 Tax=uncultured Luteimonas sp. TaxID=453144 RepID=UPI0026147F20|nr:hypothetical protein [uncultured Luteimonas sp.]
MDGVLEVGGVDTGALCNEAVGEINPDVLNTAMHDFAARRRQLDLARRPTSPTRGLFRRGIFRVDFL